LETLTGQTTDSVFDAECYLEALRLLEDHRKKIYKETDGIFARLFGLQWLAGIAIALWSTPFSWSGAATRVHPHVWSAVLMGGAISIVPIALVRLQPGAAVNRYVIAVSQMLTSSLLIHLTGGRIESHFHIFGSLAFLAFYRDWRVLVTASIVAALDHFLRGMYLPASIYGAGFSDHRRWLEHVGWILFADVFLIRSCLSAQTEMFAIAQREAKQTSLLHQAQYDALTGIPNRALFVKKIESALRKARELSSRFAVLFLDLDRFKQINDSFGHHVGDQLLREVGTRLTGYLRAGESLARMGGDEFAVICENIDSIDDAKQTAATLLQALSTQFDVGGHHLIIGASIGISIYPESGESVTDLQKNADIAMYSAKKSGNHGFECFSPERVGSVLNVSELEFDLHEALKRNELAVHYQPQVRLDGELAGFEALVRWNHPIFGLLAPSEFVPLAEESGLINSIGNWVLQEACAQAARWDSCFGRNLRMAVNVSALQFAKADFPASVARTLAQTGLSPRLLELEITETLIMSDMAKSGPRMQQLRELGVRIAIDDFGIGYSSLRYLQKLPLDVLKIDREFVSGLCIDAGTFPLVESIIALAHNLRLEVVAEGVEERSQIKMLSELGCEYAQGFLFSEPRPAEEAGAFISQSNFSETSWNTPFSTVRYAPPEPVAPGGPSKPDR
jgi:diguanylate cyclase (GGDEF)-like protein